MHSREYKIILDKQLRAYVKKKITFAQHIAWRPRPQQVIAYIEDAIFAWWKRIRPYLIYLMYKIYGWTNDKEVIRFSGAVELIHSLALIHDDIIDQGTVRHWLPCVHIFAADLLNGENKEHIGIAQGLLAWDLVYARAYDVLYAPYDLPQKNLALAQKNMQLMIEEVVSGQMIDVDIMAGWHVDKEKIDKKNHYKTGQYTFTRPMITGALLAGAAPKVAKKREKIGTLLGKAYQLRDDILDVTITSGDNTAHYDNKTKFSDMQDGQQTFLTNYIYDNGTYAQRLAISRAMGKRLTQAQIDELRTVFVTSGAIAYGETILRDYLDQAYVLIEKMPTPYPAYKEYLYHIIHLLRTL